MAQLQIRKNRPRVIDVGERQIELKSEQLMMLFNHAFRAHQNPNLHKQKECIAYYPMARDYALALGFPMRSARILATEFCKSLTTENLND